MADPRRVRTALISGPTIWRGHPYAVEYPRRFMNDKKNMNMRGWKDVAVVNCQIGFSTK
jgi:hypothetical protein